MTVTDDRATPVDVHVRVQRFYAAQMRLLDAGEAERWAGTFTEDGEFGQDNGSPPRRGRATIAAGMRAAVDRRVAAGVVTRHWMGMVAVHPLPDGSVRTGCYALVVRAERGGPPAVGLSTTCADVLVPDGDSWLVRSRWVSHDGTPGKGFPMKLSSGEGDGP
ncbi:nuclear transport factor 2 family protein [Actinosynnema sp. NPDC023658]|uniref:nuclear transport factor 2 family protein n=1 Tax=Actinosynnema sp. NPDC023658 TaxID=3155465 RepID=UPI0033ED003D